VSIRSRCPAAGDRGRRVRASVEVLRGVLAPAERAVPPSSRVPYRASAALRSAVPSHALSLHRIDRPHQGLDKLTYAPNRLDMRLSEAELVGAQPVCASPPMTVGTGDRATARSRFRSESATVRSGLLRSAPSHDRGPVSARAQAARDIQRSPRLPDGGTRSECVPRGTPKHARRLADRRRIAGGPTHLAIEPAGLAAIAEAPRRPQPAAAGIPTPLAATP
jgi:hypothetical protein